MLRALPWLILLAGCPSPDDTDTDTDTDVLDTDSTWGGTMAGHTFTGAPSAVYYRSSNGSVTTVYPTGTVSSAGTIGVEYDPSITVVLTDIPEPCETLAGYMEVLARGIGNGAPDVEALEQLPDLVPDQYQMVTVGVGVESGTGDLVRTYDVDVEQESDGQISLGGAAFQTRPIPWSDVLDGAADLEDSVSVDDAVSGQITIDEADLDGGRVLGSAAFVGFQGDELDVAFEAVHCPDLQAALTLFID